jgi:hypothetical protein
LNTQAPTELRVHAQADPQFPDTLRVRVQGEETFDNTLAYWRRLGAAAAAHGAVRKLLLMDELRGGALTEAQWLELVIGLQEDRNLGALRIAHVRVWGLREIEYCELYAQDAGMQARVFADEASARQWLQQA